MLEAEGTWGSEHRGAKFSEAERQGETDKKEARAGPRGERGAEVAIFRRAPRPQIRANERARADDSSRTFAS